ncbi:MAG TPA: 3-methyl-2-oxobutanoate hydroxymethyltransferase [Albidovulum sp.]|uniref:3-methyl-2-oxobutanoate hydroxymethyltransferase n=1 Tax=Albidovulum sp. TaxID=1872424 RepID=UPI002BDFAD88|nr:3-methyl-2-oxobutanoate hydroxymethyltransferase [Albidovulum sp.]
MPGRSAWKPSPRATPRQLSALSARHSRSENSPQKHPPTVADIRPLGKTAEEVLRVLAAAKRLEEVGCFGAELEVVPDRVGEFISKNIMMLMLGMGAGPGRMRWTFSPRMCWAIPLATSRATPRPATSRRNMRVCRQSASLPLASSSPMSSRGAYTAPQRNVPMADAKFESFLAGTTSARA